MRLLVLEGNSLAGRRRIAETAGATPGESYAALLRKLAPNAAVDIHAGADQGAVLPGPLEGYDGMAVTGSSLNIYQREPESTRQIDFLKEVFGRGIPVFGSCWGLQLAAVAAGGDVQLNPAGREVAFARKIILTSAGRRHPMHAGRSEAFDAPAIHSDIVTRLPANTVVTASNGNSEVQAAEIRFGKGVFWGVQYHPEYGLHDIAAVIRRYGQILVNEGFFAELADLQRYAADLATLGAEPERRDIAWRLGLDEDIVSSETRQTELKNWVDFIKRRA
ncbi:type 1 glutamine amidotransferase [Bradyrhizobium sp.]|uniref:type 1 glutamine amidotransferase n=1 Tax=Bradyrhizobium sp. TaxID=376 RepID=UPI0039E44694